MIAAETIKNIPMGRYIHIIVNNNGSMCGLSRERFGRAEECAGVVSFLCSEDASYVTGETIVIAGGMPSRL